MAEFIDNLAFVNDLAERSRDLCGAMRMTAGSAIETRPFASDPRMAINLSVWTASRRSSGLFGRRCNKRFYGRRHEWFERMDERYFVMWWVPAEHRPTVQEAVERLRHLRQHGPSDHAFGWESPTAASQACSSV